MFQLNSAEGLAEEIGCILFNINKTGLDKA